MHKIFELITEIIGWMQIVFSFTFLGIVLGYGIYYNFQNSYGIVCGIFVAFLGLLIGIFWAIKKFKSTGTIHFLSRIGFSQVLNNLEKTNTKNTKSKK
jgi:hypothetical protein